MEKPAASPVNTFSMILVVFLYLSSFLIITFTNAFFTPTVVNYSCPSFLNYTINSTYYQSNLKLLFSSLSSNATFNISNGLSQVIFRNATAGQAPDEVFGLFLCRPDLNSTTCRDCLTYATRGATRICATQKRALIWYDECHLRYSNKSFFSIVDYHPSIGISNTENVTEPDKFDDSVLSFMNAAASKAAYSPDKFVGAKKENITVNETLYGFVQCTPDLSSRDCFACLRASNAELPLCCKGKKGGRILTPSCSTRYELYPFFNESFISTLEPAPPLEPPPVSLFPPASGSEAGSQGGKRRQAVWIAIGTIIPAILVLKLSGYFLPQIWRRYKEEKAKRRALQVLRSGDEQSILREKHEVESQDFPIFPLGQILEATRHFSDENKLGEGGFGPVYKGVLADGKEIAVKRLSRTSGQGLQEFKSEVTLVAKLQHKNLVRLLGCCLEEKESLLIYEYMPNKSLNVHLFDSTNDIQLDWKRRMSIINGIARGLLYLHEDSRFKIIHRDLKTSNILLDHDMNQKISDFGMARIFGGNQNEANTNKVVGTYGYMAPEYAMEGIFSVKSDVYSFGVLLLEIMSGRKNTRFHLSEHDESLLSYAWKLWREGHALELMDPEMVQSCVPVEFLKYIHIGLLCVQEDPVNRPTMSSIIVMLVSDTITLPKPTQPAFSVGRFVGKSDQASSTSGKGSSINEATISNVIPR